MKPRCKHCGNAFLELDARGVPLAGKIKCELDGKVHDNAHSCDRFVSPVEVQK
jgi:hypothetical protein